MPFENGRFRPLDQVLSTQNCVPVSQRTYRMGHNMGHPFRSAISRSCEGVSHVSQRKHVPKAQTPKLLIIRYKSDTLEGSSRTRGERRRMGGRDLSWICGRGVILHTPISDPQLSRGVGDVGDARREGLTGPARGPKRRNRHRPASFFGDLGHRGTYDGTHGPGQPPK